MKANYEYEAERSAAENINEDLAEDLLDSAHKICKTEPGNILETNEVKLDLKKFKKQYKLSNVSIVDWPVILVNKNSGKLIKHNNVLLTWAQKLFKSKWLSNLIERNYIPLSIKNYSFNSLEYLVDTIRKKKSKVYLYKISNIDGRFIIRYTTFKDEIDTINTVKSANNWL